MAVFVDLGEDDDEPSQSGPALWNGLVDVAKPVLATSTSDGLQGGAGKVIQPDTAGRQREDATIAANLNRNSMTRALGCYP